MVFPANPLESVLARLRAGAASADQLLTALAEHRLWVPLPAGAGPQDTTSLPVLVLDDAPYVTVYTSDEQYARGAGQQAHMVLDGRTLAAVMADELGLAVNPGAECGLPVRPDGVRAIRGGIRRVQRGSTVRLGQPAAEPTRLLAEVATAFTAVPSVTEARRALAQFGEQPPVLLIAVRDSTGPSAALAAVREAIQRVGASYPVDVTPMADDADPITAWLLTNTEPFYRTAG